MNNIHISKVKLRKRMRLTRKRLKYINESSPWDAARNFLSLIKNIKGMVVGSYWPNGSELDTKPLMSALLENNAKIALPNLKKGKINFHEWKPGESLHQNNIYEPRKDSKTIVPQIILVPLLAFDSNGNRLGQGLGCYDKYAAYNPNQKYFGYAYFDQKIYKVPREEHDIILNKIITDKLIFNVKVR